LGEVGYYNRPPNSKRTIANTPNYSPPLAGGDGEEGGVFFRFSSFVPVCPAYCRQGGNSSPPFEKGGREGFDKLQFDF
jgi:hypothetical protein